MLERTKLEMVIFAFLLSIGFVEKAWAMEGEYSVKVNDCEFKYSIVRTDDSNDPAMQSPSLIAIFKHALTSSDEIEKFMIYMINRFVIVSMRTEFEDVDFKKEVKKYSFPKKEEKWSLQEDWVKIRDFVLNNPQYKKEYDKRVEYLSKRTFKIVINKTTTLLFATKSLSENIFDFAKGRTFIY